MRIDTLGYNNTTMQGTQRREWLRLHSPQHLQNCTALVLDALRRRPAATSQSTLVLGAGACTEVPLAELARASDEVVLMDLDLAAMQRARNELTSLALRKRVRLVQCDISGGASALLAHFVKQQRWETLTDAQAIFDTAAHCLDTCQLSDPPELLEDFPGSFGLVVSSLVLSQLFSYPILDLLDHIQQLAPHLSGEQERHRRYQETAQAFRVRIIEAHLHLLKSMLDSEGLAVLLTDVRGFVFNVHETDLDATHRRAIPLVPHAFFDLVHANFHVQREEQWEWLTDLPEKERPGRGYEVTGYLLRV